MNRHPNLMDLATITLSDGVNSKYKLPGQNGEIRFVPRTVGSGNYSEGDVLPMLFEGGDPNRPLVQTDGRGTKRVVNNTVKSPWISGSNPPQQDPAWKVGM